MLKLIFFIISLVSIIPQDNASTNITLNYYHTDAKVYSIVKEEEKFKIITKQVIYCLVAPCIFPVLDETTITDEEDYKNLQNLFLEIFKDSKENEISVNQDELTPKQWEIISNVFENNNIFSEVKYKISKNGNYNSQYKERGYYYKEENDNLIITITMGEKNTGGYSIDIKKVKIKENSATIYVNEKYPNPGEGVTMAFTYPSVEIKFNKILDNIEVINYETGEEFDRL